MWRGRSHASQFVEVARRGRSDRTGGPVRFAASEGLWGARTYVREGRSRRVRCLEMAWLRADDVFSAADAQADALNSAPWLHRRNGPLRKPDEGRIKDGCGVADLEDRLRDYAAKIAQTEQALADAGPTEQRRLRQRLAAFHTFRRRLLRSQPQQS